MKNLGIAVPTIVAIVGIAVVARMTLPIPTETHVPSALTVYSHDHARVQSREGEAEPLPATF